VRHRITRLRADTVTFLVEASKGEAKVVTVRLSVAVAMDKARTLLAEGWEVSITGPDGIRYAPAEFDELLRHGRTVSSNF
jgi:hypothetical protein